MSKTTMVLLVLYNVLFSLSVLNTLAVIYQYTHGVYIVINIIFTCYWGYRLYSMLK